MHPVEEIDQLLGLLRRQTGEGLVAGVVGDIPDAAEHRPRLRGQVQAAGAAVGGVGAALDPAGLLHAVDLAHQGHRPDFQKIGEAGLVDALVAGEIAERAALRPGQSEPPAAPVLVEPAPEQARDVVDEKAEAAIEIHLSPRNGTLA